MRLEKALVVVFFALSVSACDKGNYLDREFTDSQKAYTNVFELLKDFDKQTEAPGQFDGVRVIRYYEKNGRYAGYTNQASTWFTLITEKEVKQLLVRIVERSSGESSADLEKIVGPVKVVDGIGFYLATGPCTFISLLKRVTGPNKADNDYGDPDFVGGFRICSGLTVTPEQFIEKIGLADEDAEARYLKVISGTAASISPHLR